MFKEVQSHGSGPSRSGHGRSSAPPSLFLLLLLHVPLLLLIPSHAGLADALSDHNAVTTTSEILTKTTTAKTNSKTRKIAVDDQGDDVQNDGKPWKFGMASGASSFFDPIRQGFLETCALLQVECEYFAENNTEFGSKYDVESDKAHCVPQMRDMMDRNFDGISLYCGVDHPVLQQAIDRGIVLSSFDIRPPASDALGIPYVGTDNENVGESMARLLRLLRQIAPGDTGTYYAFSFRRVPVRYQGFVREIEKDNDRTDRGHWRMITTNLTGNPQGDDLVIGEGLDSLNTTTALDRLAPLNPDAIIFMNQSPMRQPGYTEWVERNRWRNITIIGLQGNDEELQTLARRNVDGLIGQVAFDIGRLSAQTLYDLKAGRDVPPVRFTKLINYNLVPERLPDPNVDENRLGNLKVFGYVAFAVVACTSAACLAWTVYHRKGTAVRSSQPIFLAMTATGIFVQASAIIPLSMEAGDADDNLLARDTWARGVCMSPVWLLALGFSVTFSALFAKTWRVNRFFNSRRRYERIRVQERDVLVPFSVVVTLNIIILTIWTVVDPLTYTREFEDGTDLYNREIASNGYCRSDHAEYFLVPLTLVNMLLLVVACWQAYHARNIKSEFAEASYIALAVFSFMQAFTTGIPVVAVVRDDPQAFYVVLTCIIFVLSMVILLLIFFPKFRMEKKYQNMSPQERRQSLAVSVRTSMVSRSDGSHRADMVGAVQVSGLAPPPLPSSASPHQKTVTIAAPPMAMHHNKPKENYNGAESVMHPIHEDQEAEGVDARSVGVVESTQRTSEPLYGSLVEKLDDDGVVGDKTSTYASEELVEELKALEKKDEQQKMSHTTGKSSSTTSSSKKSSKGDDENSQ